MANNRAALLVRCTEKEKRLIREGAKHEHRTLSGYILHTVMSRIEHNKKLEQEWQRRGIRPRGLEIEEGERSID